MVGQFVRCVVEAIAGDAVSIRTYNQVPVRIAPGTEGTMVDGAEQVHRGNTLGHSQVQRAAIGPDD